MSWYHRLFGIPDPIAAQQRAKDERVINSRVIRAEKAIARVDRIVHEWELAEQRLLGRKE